jgi:hypothetical protein
MFGHKDMTCDLIAFDLIDFVYYLVQNLVHFFIYVKQYFRLSTSTCSFIKAIP